MTENGLFFIFVERRKFFKMFKLVNNDIGWVQCLIISGGTVYLKMAINFLGVEKYACSRRIFLSREN